MFLSLKSKLVRPVALYMTYIQVSTIKTCFECLFGMLGTSSINLKLFELKRADNNFIDWPDFKSRSFILNFLMLVEFSIAFINLFLCYLVKSCREKQAPINLSMSC